MTGTVTVTYPPASASPQTVEGTNFVSGTITVAAGSALAASLAETLPTTLPALPGVMWNNNGEVAIS
jgi:hypothetical protein